MLMLGVTASYWGHRLRITHTHHRGVGALAFSMIEFIKKNHLSINYRFSVKETEPSKLSSATSNLSSKSRYRVKRLSDGGVNPIRPGGGGLRGPDDQTHSCQSETSYSMMPKLGDLRHILTKHEQN